MNWTISPDDLGLIVFVAVIALWTIILKVLGNRRQVTRHVLHGTVTYTIKGYGGPEACRIIRSLRDETHPEEIKPHENTTLTKATAKDVRA